MERRVRASLAMTREATFNRLLDRAREGDSCAHKELLPVVYEQLRDLARVMMNQERTGHTLQPTAVVNEACLRLIATDTSVEYQNRLHFFRLAAREMRRVLIEHARARNCQKREGAHERISLTGFTLIIEDNTIDLLALEEAMIHLAEVDPVKVEIIEMRYFGGLTNAEIAEVVGVTTRTIERKWEVARRRLSLLLDSHDGRAGSREGA